ncbi:gamma-glutamylcyclotransferase family protein [Aspergillus homomorphus CBS 101889]|uniref:Putative gamma-glutamylcyclotransferase n=1 Tax=Aspergillus homomorphus (strain CBS 101889) TaxID=1450537 RepID=A0A395HP25_ASPHC|nr:hypothetical protein BO97DRAFT_396854 [Aspergillus homomorphus CBS 101889]RAL09183.1 hypothetical protein BO97DRAFT_396854 [Aspergillus homomorphus CBS 101889]
MGDHVLFFYGTLMSPAILHRVIHGRADPEPWQRAYLRIQPAVLPHYRRHRVRGADYPGILPVGSSPDGGMGDGCANDRGRNGTASVLGTLVTGLTDGDVYRLDRFEGGEYSKVRVRVRVVGEEQGEGRGKDQGDEEQDVRTELHTTPLPDTTEPSQEVEALTYVWTAERERLEDAEWDFEAFKRDKLAWWVEADECEW